VLFIIRARESWAERNGNEPTHAGVRTSSRGPLQMKNFDPDQLKRLLRDVVGFIREASGLELRAYQVEVARAIIEDIQAGRASTIVVIFPRQSGKNELQAQIETYLLVRYCYQAGEMIKVSPTWRPQSLNAMHRLRRVLKGNLFSKHRFRSEAGFIFKVGKSRMVFLSGNPEAKVVVLTANLLLECDEAQDVLIDKWDKDFAPMAASTNATRWKGWGRCSER
jgi:hypothetical protein